MWVIVVCCLSRRSRYFLCVCLIWCCVSVWWLVCGCLLVLVNRWWLIGWSVLLLFLICICCCLFGNV